MGLRLMASDASLQTRGSKGRPEACSASLDQLNRRSQPLHLDQKMGRNLATPCLLMLFKSRNPTERLWYARAFVGRKGQSTLDLE